MPPPRSNRNDTLFPYTTLCRSPMFTVEERCAMVREEAKKLIGRDIEVRPFDNLLMHAAMEIGASVIIRGLRAVSDFEYEFQMVGMNARSAEHTSELQSLMRISYAVFCLKKQNKK